MGHHHVVLIFLSCDISSTTVTTSSIEPSVTCMTSLTSIAVTETGMTSLTSINKYNQFD